MCHRILLFSSSCSSNYQHTTLGGGEQNGAGMGGEWIKNVQ